MKESQRTGARKPGTPGAFSRWVKQRSNARINRRIRRGRGRALGMDVLILHTVGRRSRRPRETPVAWFAEGEHVRLIVAMGSGSQNPDWYANLMTYPEEASIELAGGVAIPVRPERLEGADRERAWLRIITEQPIFAKHQSRSGREYPVVRLSPRWRR